MSTKRAVGTSRMRSLCASWQFLVTLALFGTLAVGRVAGQVATVTVTLTEWDLPGVGAGTSPGALFISDQIARGTGDVWYVTRGFPATLIKFTPATPVGTWQRWSLEPVGTSGGLKVTRSGVAFVQLADEVVRIDTVSNTRTRWFGTSRGLSDLALDGAGSIYTTSPLARAVGYVQRLTPGGADAVMTRWYVGIGVGDVYLSGVAVHPSTGLVYYSEPTANQIGELNPRTNVVRKWALPAVGAARPGQISIDSAGDVWAVAGSGHLVRLRASTSALTSFAIPTPGSSPVGIAAAGLIGFTESATARIGALLPTGLPVVVAPSVNVHDPEHFAVAGEVDHPEPVSGTAGAVVTVMQATKVGPFIEAQLPVGSASPLGIDNTSTAGRFFYTVGESPTLNRVGAVVFPAP